ncbi:MAG: monovalent cation/H+ antiporter complex subunit F [Gammaproteobacteria bacterium]|jgi:multicomponent Na+:H+ antiporter subunit F
MNLFLTVASLVVLGTITVGLLRVLLGPHRADRMVAAQLFGTAGVAWILLLGYATDRPLLSDIALVLALLAAVTAIAFVQRAWQSLREDQDEHH